MSLVENALSLAAEAHQASNAEAGAEAFMRRLRPHGLVGVATRLYIRPEGPLDARAVGAAGGFLTQVAPPGWVGSPGWHHICFEDNPLLAAVEQRLPAFTYSQMAPKDQKRFGAYWEAWSEGSISDGFGMLSFGRGRRVASLSLAFEAMDGSPLEQAAIRMAGMMLLERSIQIAGVGEDAPKLSRRERDCMAYVAMGKTDWEIGQILSIAQATAHLHVENARRKLGAANRAHAVARMAAFDLL